jgi:hypothetical protein
VTRWLPLSWALLLTLLLLGPALAPGFVLVRDVVWVPDLALRPDTLGLGSALPRAVPSDAVVAVLDEVVPGMLLQKLVLLGSLLGAGTGAAALVGGGLAGRLAAVSVAIWNPFVVERLAMGHWPVVLGYAAVPWLAVAGRRTALTGSIPAWAPLVLLAGSLSANAGLVSAAVLLVTALSAGVRRSTTVVLVLLVVGANAPWLVAGLAHASAATGAGGYSIFATRGDGLPGPLAALTLGGIWNGDVVPASREGALAWGSLALLLVLAAVGARRWWQRRGRREAVAHLALWLAGVGLAVVSWAAPDLLASVGEHLPGAGLLRDGTRSLGLALPLTVGLVAAGADVVAGLPRHLAGRGALVAGVALLPLALMPDVAWGVDGSLDTARYPAEWRTVSRVVEPVHGDAVLLPWSAYRAPTWNGGRPVLDPLARLLRTEVVTDGDLVIGSTTVSGEDPRAEDVRQALAASTPQARADALRARGIGWVVVEKDAGDAPEVAGRVVHDGPLLEVVRLEGPVSAPEVSIGAQIAQALAWAAFVAVLLAGLVGTARTAVVRIATLRASNARVRD